jgi:hypothetical protein
MVLMTIITIYSAEYFVLNDDKRRGGKLKYGAKCKK